MNVLIHDGRVVSDPWTAVGDEEAIPPSGHIIVTLTRWTAEREALNPARTDFIAVRLSNTVDVTVLDEAILQVPLIVLEFPGFGDGRAYSQARQLRDARGYRGALRATGAAVVRDQLLGMARCGIDYFELRSDQSPAECVNAWAEFSAAYQPAIDDLPQVRTLRRKSVAR